MSHKASDLESLKRPTQRKMGRTVMDWIHLAHERKPTNAGTHMNTVIHFLQYEQFLD